MDSGPEWPWSWEEEADWKADLEERQNDFLEELLDSVVEDGTAGSSFVVELALAEDRAEDSTPEKYSVTA
jgi:hypothetical protein